jgi:hypothetical protein
VNEEFWKLLVAILQPQGELLPKNRTKLETENEVNFRNYNEDARTKFRMRSLKRSLSPTVQ